MSRSTVHTRRRTAGPASRARPGETVALAGLVARHQSQLAARALTSSELQEHVTRVASGEGSSARAVDLHQLQVRPPEAASSPPARPRRHRRQNRRCSPRRGLGRGQIGEGRCRRAQAPAEVRPQLAARESRSAALRTRLGVCSHFYANSWRGAKRRRSNRSRHAVFAAGSLRTNDQTPGERSAFCSFFIMLFMQ